MSNDDAILLDILQSARRAVEGLEQLSLDDFNKDWRAQSVVIHQLLVLGEAVKRLSIEFRTNHPGAPWRQMAGLRDILIHQDDTVDSGTVWAIVTDNLPPIIAFLETVAPPENPT